MNTGRAFDIEMDPNGLFPGIIDYHILSIFTSFQYHIKLFFGLINFI